MQDDAIFKLLPWDYPFRMLDRVLDCRPHQRIVTLKQVTADDPALGGETSELACFPSVMLLEGLSQSAALLFRLSYEDVDPARLPLLGFLKASLSTRDVRPGDSITYTVEAAKMTRSGGVFEGRASVDGETVSVWCDDKPEMVDEVR